MPLLLCPNDNTSMQTVQRSGVEFDMCPSCRGVWLDRGELEKLIGAAMDAGGASHGGHAPPPQQPGYQPQRHDTHMSHNRDHRWSDDHYRHKKRKGFDIFDIFD